VILSGCPMVRLASIAPRSYSPFDEPSKRTTR
jgi:hypothetical protein